MVACGGKCAHKTITEVLTQNSLLCSSIVETHHHLCNIYVHKSWTQCAQHTQVMDTMCSTHTSHRHNVLNTQVTDTMCSTHKSQAQCAQHTQVTGTMCSTHKSQAQCAQHTQTQYVQIHKGHSLRCMGYCR